MGRQKFDPRKPVTSRRKLGYTLTPSEVGQLSDPGEAMPFVDRPAFPGEWGVTERPEWESGGPDLIESGTGEAQGRGMHQPKGQGQFIFGEIGQHKQVIDPANLPRRDMGTPETRRAAAGRIKGLGSERTGYNVLKQIGRWASYKQLYAPPTEVRNPSGLKDTIAQSGFPPEILDALAEGGAEVKENTRWLTNREQLRAGPGDSPRAHFKQERKLNRWDRLRGKSRTDEPVNEPTLTTGLGLFTGAAKEIDEGDVVLHEMAGHSYQDVVTKALHGQRGPIDVGGSPHGTGSSEGNPHKEGFSDAMSELYTSTDTPLGADEEQRRRYGINAPEWRGPGDDSIIKHVYETTRLSTKATEATQGPEDLTMGKYSLLGTLQRLTDPDSAYTRTMYGTQQSEGGADTVAGEHDMSEPFDYDKPVQSKRAGRDFDDAVLAQGIKVVSEWPEGGGPTDRGTQLALGPESEGWAPEVDMNEQPTMSMEDAVRGGEEHLKKVVANLQTWISGKGRGADIVYPQDSRTLGEGTGNG